MQQPYADPDRDKNAEHDQPERAGDIAEHRPEGVTEEEPDRDKRCRPQTGGEKIQPQETLPFDGAETKRKGREVAYAVDKAERQDKAGVVAFQPVQRRFHAVPPSWKAVEQPNPELPAKPEITLVAGEAAEPSRRQQQQRIDQPLRGREPGKQDHSLAFEKGPNKGDRIETGAVIGNKLIDIHPGPFPPRPPA